jgi:hypothetical protein
MKLQSKDGSMVVDFYPLKTPYGDISKEWFIQILTFMGGTQSKKYLNRVEMGIQVRERLAYGYEVIDFNTIPQLGNPMAGAC